MNKLRMAQKVNKRSSNRRASKSNQLVKTIKNKAKRNPTSKRRTPSNNNNRQRKMSNQRSQGLKK